MHKMPKESLKDKLDGNNLDLSLSSLSEIPVKDLAALPKATHVDLSCNSLSSIPSDFCKLTHIVHLDLSQNQLTHLPEDIGSLKRLQHLDLYNNQLTTLPLSFCYFKTLKWLDVKGNPLLEPLRSVAGDCLDEIQCRNCAKKVVEFMKKAQSEQERRRQKQLQEEREMEAQRRAEEEREKVRRKEEKRAAKEQRRKEYEAQQAGLRRRSPNTAQDEESDSATPDARPTVRGLHPEDEERKGWTWGGILWGIMLLLLILAVGLHIQCDLYPHRTVCRQGKQLFKHYYHYFEDLLGRFV